MPRRQESIMAQKITVQLSKLKPNEANPRIIREKEFEELVRSIVDFPEMTQAKEIVVNKDYEILGGNMRYHAMLKAGWTEAPVVIVDWSKEKQDEFIIRDNTHSGDWDYDKLREKWDIEDAKGWGMDISKWTSDHEQDMGESFQRSVDENNVLEKILCPYCGHENERAA